VVDFGEEDDMKRVMLVPAIPVNVLAVGATVLVLLVLLLVEKAELDLQVLLAMSEYRQIKSRRRRRL
jgi:hypothetical protein